MSELEIIRQQKDAFFEQSPHSPLTTEQKNSFKGLNYFPKNEALDLTLGVEEFDDPQSVQIQTNTGDVQTYDRYARFKFEVEGQAAELTIFRNQNGYFLPFVDSQAGDETYGAGRYLEPVELADGRFRIDFNQAYNPYCAYNPMWSCPLTPAENRLQVPIRAGEKVFDEH